MGVFLQPDDITIHLIIHRFLTVDGNGEVVRRGVAGKEEVTRARRNNVIAIGQREREESGGK